MKIRPRLLVGSLLIAAVIIGLFVWSQRPANDDPDATLTDAGAVVTYPNTGLGNQLVRGEQLPEVTFLDQDGADVTTAELIGEPLVINLWYSTCAPCAKELPEFATVDAETDDVRFIGVNPQDSLEVMERFAGERGVQYEMLRDTYDLADGIGATAFPITLFVASDGTIIDQTGAIDAEQLRTKIGELLVADEAAA